MFKGKAMIFEVVRNKKTRKYKSVLIAIADTFSEADKFLENKVGIFKITKYNKKYDERTNNE